MEDNMPCLSELFSFGCVLRGEEAHIERIRRYIISEYVNTGLVKLINPTYDKNGVYILCESEWKEYQKLKARDERLIGAGFP
ncbi:MAG: hypothetical protein HXS53_00155 [Theionarchaea archaeon]|nr:hypothetical protein [Theionarchaea archaeon]